MLSRLSLLAALLAAWGVGAQSVWAQATDLPEAGDPAVLTMLHSLPDKTLGKLRRAPERFLTEAATLIYGYGAAQGLSRVGIEAFVAMERARVRTREMHRLLLADMDNDGTVAANEVAVLAAASSAAARGRLWAAFEAADGDRDGAVSMAELRAHAQQIARQEISAQDEEILLGFMGFDLDGDGLVTLDEVRRLVAAALHMA